MCLHSFEKKKKYTRIVIAGPGSLVVVVLCFLSPPLGSKSLDTRRLLPLVPSLTAPATSQPGLLCLWALQKTAHAISIHSPLILVCCVCVCVCVCVHARAQGQPSSLWLWGTSSSSRTGVGRCLPRGTVTRPQGYVVQRPGGHVPVLWAVPRAVLAWWDAQCHGFGLLLVGPMDPFLLTAFFSSPHGTRLGGCSDSVNLRAGPARWWLCSRAFWVLHVHCRGIAVDIPGDSATCFWQAAGSNGHRFGFFGFCLQRMKSFCKTAECQHEFYGFNLL